MREQNDLPNRRRIGQQHDQPVNADAFSGGRRHAVFQRPHVIFIHLVRLFVPFFVFLRLLFEPPFLVKRIVQLRKRVAHFLTGNVEFETFDKFRVVRFRFGKRRHFRRKIHHERRLREMRLDNVFEYLHQQLAFAEIVGVNA